MHEPEALMEDRFSPVALFAEFVKRAAQRRGDGFLPQRESAEVLPSEAIPIQPVDAPVAWRDAVSVLDFLGASSTGLTPPPEWSDFVSQLPPANVVPFALGSYPQAIRELPTAPLRFETIGNPSTSPLDVPEMVKWADCAIQSRKFPECLAAAALLRAAGFMSQATACLDSHAAVVPAEWRLAWANEQAALVFQQGHAADALAMWESQPDSVPVHFNRGVAHLVLGNDNGAAEFLGKAIERLSDTSSWRHLGKLYVALLSD